MRGWAAGLIVDMWISILVFACSGFGGLEAEMESGRGR